MQVKSLKKFSLKPSPQFVPVGNIPSLPHLLLPFPAQPYFPVKSPALRPSQPPPSGDMAKPPPRQLQPQPPLISKQGAPSTRMLINTSSGVFDGKRNNSENFMTGFAPHNGLICRNCRTQTTPDNMATLECGPNVDTWMTHWLTAAKKPHHVNDSMAENDDNLRIDFITGPQYVSTKANKRPDTYNRPMSHQIYEGDSDTHIAEFRGSATNVSFVPINSTIIDISIRRQETRHETIDKWCHRLHGRHVGWTGRG